MINDAMLANESSRNTQCDDRRSNDRVPFPAEVLLRWHYDLERAVRYRVVDVSDNGMRIRSSLPLTEGTTGMVMKLLPDGQNLDRSVMVCWSRLADESGAYHVGLRFF